MAVVQIMKDSTSLVTFEDVGQSERVTSVHKSLIYINWYAKRVSDLTLGDGSFRNFRLLYRAKTDLLKGSIDISSASSENFVTFYRLNLQFSCGSSS